MGSQPDAEAVRSLFQSTDDSDESPNRSVFAEAYVIPAATPVSIQSTSTMYDYTEQLFDSPADGDRSAGSITSAPSKIRIFVSADGMSVGLSQMQTAIQMVSDLGSFMSVVFGDHAAISLYDSGASITQASPNMIRQMVPYLTEIDKDMVEFVSVESKDNLSMRLFRCDNTSLIQVESALRSAPMTTLVVENPRLTTFPLLFGLLSMSDLDLNTGHRSGIV